MVRCLDECIPVCAGAGGVKIPLQINMPLTKPTQFDRYSYVCSLEACCVGDGGVDGGGKGGGGTICGHVGLRVMHQLPSKLKAALMASF